MTTFHNTTVMGDAGRRRRGDSSREKNRRHSYQGTGATRSMGSAFHGRRRASSHVTSWASAA